jgi:hypothetical protein
LNFNRACLILAALPALAFSADLNFEIPPLPVSVDIAGQPVAITISGHISGSATEQSLTLSLSADLSDFQNHLTPLLQSELNQSNRCGERISVENATLAPAPPAGRLTVQLHFEKWVCFKALGKENAKKLLAGNGTVQVLLTPGLEEGNAVRLDADITKIDADGPLGDVLRSEPLGTALRDKIREAMLKAIRKSTDLQAVVPAQAQPFVTLQSVAFADPGGGRIALNLNGRLRIPRDQAAAILEQFRNRTPDPR